MAIFKFQFSRSLMFSSLQPHGLQHARLSCPTPTPRAYSNSCPSSQWCHPTISSSVIVVPYSSRLQSFSASGSFPMSQFLASVSSVQSLSHVRLFATPWIAARQTSLFITNSWSSLRLTSIKSVMPSSHLILIPSPPAPNPSQHQSLFQWVNSSHQVAKVLEFQLQHQSFQWTPRTDLL